MSSVIDYYHEVIFSEPSYHKLIDWICILTIVFFAVYGSVFLLTSRDTVQGVTLPGATYTPVQPTTPSDKQPGNYKQPPVMQG